MKRNKEKTPLPSRKRRALKYLFAAALAVLLVNYTLHIGLLLPVQALRQVEEREGVRGRIVTWRWEPRVHKTGLFFLTENEDMVLLGNTYLTALGWTPGFGWAVDCTGGGPLHAGETASYREGGETVWQFYGRVDDPKIETVEISLRVITGYDEVRRENVYEEHARLTVDREAFLKKEGRSYFLVDCQLEDWPENSGVYAFAIGLDGGGKAVAEFEIEEGTHSYYG